MNIKRLPINYLKTFRRRTGFLLQDMAEIIGMNSGNLSKIETGQVTPSFEVILAYLRRQQTTAAFRRATVSRDLLRGIP